jgi:acetolactate synthase-1/2/3 large subunit
MSVDRRDFLKVAAGGAAALVGSAKAAEPQEAEAPAAGPAEVLTTDRSGSDFMVDALKSLGIEYAAAIPGSSFRGLHESCINYGGNKAPEWITCCHEEIATAMCHGYAKIEGKPMLVFLHSTVGLQHATMAVYNAYCDRTPIFLIVGNHLDGETRRPGTGDWVHAVQDPAGLVRDFTKFDDQPVSLQSFAESAVRAYKIAMTPPYGPVLLSADLTLQEHPIPDGAKLRVPKLSMTKPPQGDSGSVTEAARMLVQADNPVICADYAARTAEGLKLMVELAEALQAPVIDRASRMNFPSRHPLDQSERGAAVVGEADVILGLEMVDFWGAVNAFRDQLFRSSRSLTKPGAKLISISSGDLFIKANYQNFSRYQEVDMAIAADAEATMPFLIEEIKRQMPASRRSALQDRGARYAKARLDAVERNRNDATYGWDSSPISMARLSAELWAQIKDKDWSLLSSPDGRWVRPMWNFDKYYQHIGFSGGEGLGYGAPASVGAGLANKKHGRFSVIIESDGDLMMAPGALWTAAHHRVPILYVMRNNHAYHMETQHIARVALRRGRGIENSQIGTMLEDPNIDYAKIAQGLGLHGEGPITDPKDLGPALRRAIATVQAGEPALVDVVVQPR